ncbi:hypothetical protein U1Q18_030472 [Sarracenia purpurea var. burkii]
MAAIASSITPNPNHNVVLSLRKPLSRSLFASNSTLFGNKFLGKSLSGSTRKSPQNRSDKARFSGLNAINASSHFFDVVVIGAGIIGLTIARQFLLESDLSVAVVDAAVPCSGATGAGNVLYALRGCFEVVRKEHSELAEVTWNSSGDPIASEIQMLQQRCVDL